MTDRALVRLVRVALKRLARQAEEQADLAIRLAGLSGPDFVSLPDIAASAKRHAESSSALAVNLGLLLELLEVKARVRRGPSDP